MMDSTSGDISTDVGITKCPVCATTKAMMPNLKLMFSNCCGRCMCTHCIDGRFKHKKDINCDLCNEQLKKTSFSVYPIEEQRFQSEISNRQEANKTLVLEECDFPDVRAYNDYLETCADIIYEMTYGNKGEQASAKLKLSEFAKHHRAAIDKSKSRRLAERSEQERRERMGVMQATAGVANMAPISNALGSMASQLSFALPELDSTAVDPREADEAIAAIADVKIRAIKEQELRDKRRVAAGYRREEHDKKRSKQEMTDELFGWHWPTVKKPLKSS